MNIKRIICLLSVALAASVTPAHASSISLALVGPVSPGSSFDVAVQVNDVFAGRAPDDVVIGYGFNVTIGNGSVVQFLSETAGPLFDDSSGWRQRRPPVLPPTFSVSVPEILSAPYSQRCTSRRWGPASSSIDVTWDPTDLNQVLVYLDLPYGAIEASTRVTAAAAVPERRLSSCLRLASWLSIRARRRKR